MTGTSDRTAGFLAHPSRWAFLRVPSVAITLWGAGAALAIGLAVGDTTLESTMRGVFFFVATVMLLALNRPFEAFLGIAFSVVMLIVVPITLSLGVNLLDLLIPPVFLAGFLGTPRQDAAVADAKETGDRHNAIRGAQRRLSRAVILYYSLAALSVVRMFFDGRAAAGSNSVLCLVRAVQGLLLFALGLWFLRSEHRIRQTIVAMCVATIGLLAVNIPVRLLTDVRRAGMTWFITYPQAPIADPNEGAAGMLIVIALLMVLRTARPHWSQVLLAAAAAVMLVMTFSRSGLLAFIVFGALVLPGARLRPVLVVGAVLALALPLVPPEYWQRMMRTLLMQKGTWDNFSSMIRFISWSTAANVFIHNPIFGVGYVGLESVSTAYNDMRVRIGAESYFLEMAADLGIVGLIALGTVLVRLMQLGREIARVVPTASLGHKMATLNGPMLIAVMVANLTGSNLIGMVGIGQIALWSAMMVRAGHEALRAEASGPVQAVRAAPA